MIALHIDLDQIAPIPVHAHILLDVTRLRESVSVMMDTQERNARKCVFPVRTARGVTRPVTARGPKFVNQIRGSASHDVFAMKRVRPTATPCMILASVHLITTTLVMMKIYSSKKDAEMFVNALLQVIPVVFRTRPCASVRTVGPVGSARQNVHKDLLGENVTASAIVQQTNCVIALPGNVFLVI